MESPIKWEKIKLMLMISDLNVFREYGQKTKTILGVI